MSEKPISPLRRRMIEDMTVRTHSIFIEGFRTPATVQAASLRSAGIRNPQQTRKWRAVRGESASPPMNGHHQTGPTGPFRARKRHYH
jgi:hypothetical protein